MRETARICFIGSVDDGKSTLVGRILLEAGALFSDQLSSLKKAGGIELAWATDGLASEREQGITIDVAYRHFSTGRRDYLIADTPGHEAHTRNMASGASFAELGVILLDASRGVTEQTFRHLAIAEFMGVRKVIFAINKMDLVDYSQAAYEKLISSVRGVVDTLHFSSVHFVPISALGGDGVFQVSANFTWYHGSSLIDVIDSIPMSLESELPLRLAIQTVIQVPGSRYYAGRLTSGRISVGQDVQLLPSRRTSCVTDLISAGRSVQSAESGDSVAISLRDDVDLSRGEMICDSTHSCQLSQLIRARILWFGTETLRSGDSFLIKQGPLETKATVMTIESGTNLQSLREEPVTHVSENSFALVRLQLVRPAMFDERKDNLRNSRFILIDKLTGETCGAGSVAEVLTENNTLAVTPKTLWMTGLSGAGKSTLAEGTRIACLEHDQALVVLDGDQVRDGLSKGLGFSPDDRSENLRRIAEVCRLLNNSGISVVVAVISPSQTDRDRAKAIIGAERFREVFVDAPLELCKTRDPKGLYKKAVKGEIQNFTGVSAPYERPTQPDLHLDTSNKTVSDCVLMLMALIKR